MLKNAKLSYYPVSLIVLVLWVVYTLGVIAVLEYAVSHPNMAGIRALQQGPDMFITIFAQGHLAITSMHLSRLGMSALQHPRLAPTTWLEMFWFTNKQWQSPTGWGTTILTSSKRQIRLSITFIMFMCAVIFAMPVPLLLKRAYAPTAIEAAQPFTLPTSSLAADSTNHLDPYTQVNIGQTGWSSGASVEETYTGRVYTPTPPSANSSFANLGDLLFSADIDGYDGVLPGVRVQGGCSVLDTHNMDLGSNSDNATNAFLHLCDKWDLEGAWIADFSGMNMTANIGVCHNFPATTMDDAGWVYWNITGANRTETAIIWLNLSDYSKAPATEGFIQCSSDITTGIAHLISNVPTPRGPSFEAFTPRELFKFDTTNDRVPFWPPLFTALNFATLPMDSSNDTSTDTDVAMWEKFISAGKMIGFELSSAWDGERQLYRKPTLDEAASALWSGALHMVAAINVGASANRQESVTQRFFVPWWSRDPLFLACAAGMLSAWLATMLVLTMLLYRPAFASSMDSYTIVRLCAERPDLVEGDCSGDLSDNPKMLEPFRSTESRITREAQKASNHDERDQSEDTHSANLPVISKTI